LSDSNQVKQDLKQKWLQRSLGLVTQTVVNQMTSYLNNSSAWKEALRRDAVRVQNGQMKPLDTVVVRQDQAQVQHVKKESA